jgi:undecaprenyl-diphosphatase
MRLISRSGDLGLIWFCACLTLLFWLEYRRIARTCIFTLLLTALLGEGMLKHIFRRPRPFVTHGPVELTIPMPTSFSFPSGHTASSIAAARVLSLAGPRIALAAFCYAVLIAFSRVYLKAHYVTDVVAGSLVGLVCAELMLWLLA